MSFWAIVSLGIASPALYIFYRKFFAKKPQDINEVLFFPEEILPCNNIIRNIDSSFLQRKCKTRQCLYSHGMPEEEQSSSLIRILDHLARARSKLDLCLYLICYPTLADLVIDLHKNHNVAVRIITDGSEDEAIDSKTEKLRSAGISIRSNLRGSGAIMHHKFAVVDDEVVLAGSFNWTKKAIFCNYENVIITSQEDLVRPFVKQFEKLWSDNCGFQQHPERPIIDNGR